MKTKDLPFKGAAQLKSYYFAMAIVEAGTQIQKEHKEYVMSKQLIRSGTSVGANLQEAEGRQTGKDLLTKLHIAYKEARESRYWIYLLRDTNLISLEKSTSLINYD